MRSCAASLTLGVTMLLASAPAQAQPTGTLREAREIDRLFAQAETARLNGNCPQRDALLTQAETRIHYAYNLSEPGRNEYNLRLAEARVRPCPPTTTTPPPPPPVEQIPPTGTTPPPDRSIMDEMSDGVAPVTTTPPAPAPPPLSGPQREVMNRVESAFSEAENARGTGRCAERDLALSRISDAIDVWAGSGLDVGLIENWRARLAAAKALPCPPRGAAADRRIGFLFGGGFGEISIPRANYGFNRDGTAGSDQPAAFSERHVRTWDFTGRARMGHFGLLLLGYRTGDASNRTEIPVSTTGGAQGTVNTAMSPGGSTGGAANRGLTVDTNTEVKEFSGSARFDVWTFGGESTWSPVQSPRRRDRGVSAEMFGELFINYRERDHFGEVNIPGVPAGTPPVINQVIEQDVDELEIGAALGVETRVPLGSNAQFTFGVDLGVYYFDHGVDTLQTNRQLVGGPQDLAFTLEQQDGESGIAYHGDAITELGFNLSRSVDLFVRGEVSYFSHRAQVMNPFSGNFVLAGGTTFLDSDDALDWSVGIGLRIGF